jgi:hypothetical protein
MSVEAAPERITVLWAAEARVDQILYCVDRYLASHAGDVKKLEPPRCQPLNHREGLGTRHAPISTATL